MMTFFTVDHSSFSKAKNSSAPPTSFLASSGFSCLSVFEFQWFRAGSCLFPLLPSTLWDPLPLQVFVAISLTVTPRLSLLNSRFLYPIYV